MLAGRGRFLWFGQTSADLNSNEGRRENFEEVYSVRTTKFYASGV